MFDLVSTKGPNLDYAKAEFAAPIPPSITKDKPYAFNLGYLSDSCKFAYTSVDAIVPYGWSGACP